MTKKVLIEKLNRKLIYRKILFALCGTFWLKWVMGQIVFVLCKLIFCYVITQQQMKESQGRKLFGDWRKLLGDASTSSAPSQERMYTQSEVDALLVKTDAIFANTEALLKSQTNALFTSLSNALQAADIHVPPVNSTTVCE